MSDDEMKEDSSSACSSSEEEDEGPMLMVEIHDKLMASEISLISCCPEMDLLAMTTKDNELRVIRWSRPWQNLFNIPGSAFSANLTAIAWRPDGKTLALGLEDGSLVFYDTERKEALPRTPLAYKHKSAVTCLQWPSQQRKFSPTTMPSAKTEASTNVHREHWRLRRRRPLPQSKRYQNMGNTRVLRENEVQFFDDTSRFILVPPPLPKTQAFANFESAAVETFLPSQTQRLSQQDVLISGDASGTLALSIFGDFVCCTINLAIIPEDSSGVLLNTSQCTAVQDVCTSADLTTITVTLRPPSKVERSSMSAMKLQNKSSYSFRKSTIDSNNMFVLFVFNFEFIFFSYEILYLTLFFF